MQKKGRVQKKGSSSNSNNSRQQLGRKSQLVIRHWYKSTTAHCPRKRGTSTIVSYQTVSMIPVDAPNWKHRYIVTLHTGCPRLTPSERNRICWKVLVAPMSRTWASIDASTFQPSKLYQFSKEKMRNQRLAIRSGSSKKLRGVQVWNSERGPPQARNRYLGCVHPDNQGHAKKAECIHPLHLWRTLAIVCASAKQGILAMEVAISNSE